MQLDVTDLPSVVWMTDDDTPPSLTNNLRALHGLVDYTRVRVEEYCSKVNVKNHDVDGKSITMVDMPIKMVHMENPIFHSTYVIDIATDKDGVMTNAMISFLEYHASLKSYSNNTNETRRKCIIIIVGTNQLAMYAQKSIRYMIDKYSQNTLIILATSKLSCIDVGIRSRSTIITKQLSKRIHMYVLLKNVAITPIIRDAYTQNHVANRKTLSKDTIRTRSNMSMELMVRTMTTMIYALYTDCVIRHIDNLTMICEIAANIDHKCRVCDIKNKNIRNEGFKIFLKTYDSLVRK